MGRQRAHHDHRVAFTLEIEGESHPEIAGSLDGKDGVFRIASGQQECYFFPKRVGIALITDIKAKGLPQLQAIWVEHDSLMFFLCGVYTDNIFTANELLF
jgi:hypothetical protein